MHFFCETLHFFEIKIQLIYYSFRYSVFKSAVTKITIVPKTGSIKLNKTAG